MRAMVDVGFVLAILGMEVFARPELPLVSAAALCWLLVQICFDPAQRYFHAWIIGSALLFLGFMSIYFLNPTHHLEGALGLVPLENMAGLPGSANPDATMESIRFSAIALILAGCALRFGRLATHLLFVVLILAGLAMAGLVIQQRLSPNEYQIFPRTGWFAYENHYAAFANLILPLLLAIGMRLQHSARMRGRVTSMAPVFYLAALVVVASIYLARSRAAFMISLLIIAGYFAINFWLRYRRAPEEWAFLTALIPRWLITSASVLIVSVVMGWLVHRLWGTAGKFGGELGFRAQIISDSLTILFQNIVWGTGPGTFASVFPYYQSAALDGKMVSHVHCDPIQFLTEYGLAGLMLSSALLFLLIRHRPVMGSGRRDTMSFRCIEVPALGIGLAGLMLHSCVDFPWRNNLIAMLGIIYAALWLGAFDRIQES